MHVRVDYNTETKKNVFVHRIDCSTMSLFSQNITYVQNISNCVLKIGCFRNYCWCCGSTCMTLQWIKKHMHFYSVVLFLTGLSKNGSPDESLIKAAKNPQVTKDVWIILERCDSEQTVWSLNKHGMDYISKTLFIL